MQARLATPARSLGSLGAKAKASSKGKGAKGSLFSPGGTSAQLWMRNPDKRKVDLSGGFGPEDTIIAVARGMHPGVLRDMDDRATIRGALTVLKSLGVGKYASINISKLKSTTANTAEDDKVLAKAGGGSTIRTAANHMRKVVHAHKLDRAAWGARQLYILDNLTGFTVGRTLAVAVVGAIPIGVTQIVAAAVAAHGAISAAIAKQVVTEATEDMKDGLAAAKKAADAKKNTKSKPEDEPGAVTTTYKASASTTAMQRTAAEPVAAPEASDTLWGASKTTWFIGGALALTAISGALVLRNRRKKA